MKKNRFGLFQIVIFVCTVQAFDFSLISVERSIEGIDTTVQICARAVFDTLNGLDCSVVVEVDAIDGPKAGIVIDKYSIVLNNH